MNTIKPISSKAKPTSKRLMALTAAAAAIPVVSHPARAAAPTDTVISYRYTDYQESALKPEQVISGDLDRYSIKVNQLSLAMPLGGHWSIAIALQDETLSGASPWYNTPGLTEQVEPDYDNPQVVMTGASPGYEDGKIVGIDEHRVDGSFASTYYYEGGSVSGSIAFSTEDDYESISGGLSLEREFDKKQTVVAVGLSYSDDNIFYEDITRIAKYNTSNPLPENVGKTNISGFFSVSRILSGNSIVLGGFSYSNKEGYLSDPYKKYDKRPEEREAYTLNLSYRYYVKAIQGAWHLDYRYYDDNWGVDSNTFSVALYKTWEKLQFVPSLRYYGQSAANFYDVYALYRKDGILGGGANGGDYLRWNYYADDARLSDYGAFTFGFKIVFKQKPIDWVFGVEYYTADEEFLPGNSDVRAHPGMIEYTRFTFGIDHTF